MKRFDSKTKNAVFATAAKMSWVPLLMALALAGCDSQATGENTLGASLAPKAMVASTDTSLAGLTDAAAALVQLPIKCAAPSTMATGVTCADYGFRIVYTINYPAHYGDWGPNTMGLFATPKGGSRITYDATFTQTETSTYTENCVGGQVVINTFGSGNHAVGYGNLVAPCAAKVGSYHVTDNYKYNQLDATLARHALTFNLSIDRPASIGIKAGTVTVRVFQ